MKFFNTLTRQKEEFSPLIDQTVNFYTCGPTVYGPPHIGNLRTILTSDLVRRVLERSGYSVRQVLNITDIDDKTIAAAAADKRLLSDFTREYEAIFLNNLVSLNILRPTALPRATDFIPHMLALISEMLELGAAYVGSDGVYFKINAFPNYGRLSRLVPTGQTVSRVANDEYGKETAADFALWKFERPSDNGAAWDAPFGRGRPGWHIECSAMIKALLLETIDIHLGGTDLIFPHHENEIAQSETVNGAPLARFWLHSAFVMMGQDKMAKSLGNVIRLKDLTEKKFSPLAYRYLILTTHYRAPLNFSWDALTAAAVAYGKICVLTQEWSSAMGEGKIIVEYQKQFDQALADDLNAPQALAVVWNMLKDDKIKRRDKLATLLDFDNFLGLGLVTAARPDEIPPLVTELVKKREEARRDKNWAIADQLRQEIQQAGYEVKDTESGQSLIHLSST